MITNIILFLIISAGSVFCASLFNKKYEEVIPLTCFSIIAVMYFCGIFGFLKAGVYVVCAICLILYAIAGYFIIKRKSFKGFLKNTLTPAFVLFALFFVVLNICNNGRLAYAWDEFSHWADIVKAMWSINDFGTNPAANSTFTSYPPAMSLFQYFSQILYNVVGANNIFSEWRLFFVYQLFFISLFVPFLKGLSFKKLLSVIASGVAIFLLPFLFYNNVYSTLYIDPVIGMLAGFGMAMLLINKQKSILETLTIVLSMFILVLMKDSGIMFAVFLAAAFIIEEVFCGASLKELDKSGKIKLLLRTGGAVFAIAIAKLTWNFNIKQNGAFVSFTGKIDFIELFQILLGKSSGYRRSLVGNYIGAFLTTRVTLGDTAISLSYCGIFVVFLAMLYSLYRYYAKTDKDASQKRKMFFVCIVVELVVYIFGLCVIYMYKFSEYEATQLASFSRYMSVVFLMVWVVLIMAGIDIMKRNPLKTNGLAIILLCVLILTTPMYEAYKFTGKVSVQESINARAAYTLVADESLALIKENNARIYFICQESTGYEYWVMRFSLRPCTFSPGFTWSIGKPFYEGDIWTMKLSAEEWQQDLLNNYDYVLLYHINDYFTKYYSRVFSDKSTLADGKLYMVDKDTGFLDCLD